MNEDHRSRSRTIPFARPARDSRGGGDARAADGRQDDWDAMLELVRQQPDINISKTILLYSQVSSGRYRIDSSRLADRILEFEGRLRNS